MTRPLSSVTPRCRMRSRFMRAIARNANASAGTVASGRVASLRPALQGVGAAPCQRAHHVALGDNACLGGRRRLLAALEAHEEEETRSSAMRLQRDGDRSRGANLPACSSRR